MLTAVAIAVAVIASLALAPFASAAANPVAAAPTGSVSKIAIAALPSPWSGMTLARRVSRPRICERDADGSFSLDGRTLNTAKNAKLITGRKKTAINHSGKRTARKRRRVSTTPTQIKGRANASMLAKKAASSRGSEVIRTALAGGI